MKITRNGAVTALPGCSGGGPLVSHLDRFATFLASEGYAATTVHVKCTLVAELSLWLKRHKVPLAKLDDQRGFTWVAAVAVSRNAETSRRRNNCSRSYAALAALG